MSFFDSLRFGNIPFSYTSDTVIKLGENTMKIVIFTSRLLTLVLALPLLIFPDQAAAETFLVTATECSTSPGGYQWAIEQANNTPGRDIISIEVPIFYVDDCFHPEGPRGLPIAITESVDIVGNGNTVDGRTMWINSSGQINPGQCPQSDAAWVNFGGALLDVGIRGTNSGDIEVTVTGLKMKRLTTVGYVRRNAKLTLEDCQLMNLLSVIGNCDTPLITVEDGADLTMKRTRIDECFVPTEAIPSTSFPLITALIFGHNGDLVMENVTIGDTLGSPHAASILWGGGSVKVVSSSFLDSNGFWLINSTMDFVNSVFQSYDFGVAYFSENIILNNGSVFTSEASTFYWESIGCTNCNVTQGSGSGATEGLGFVGYPSSYGTPSVSFKSTALGSIDAPEPLQKLWGDPQVFSSDVYTWIQPTAGQDAAALATIVPNASTAAPGLTTQYNANYLEQRRPIIFGELEEAVPDAGAGGVNQLFSPIDGSLIALDINGAPRVYDNGTRNIGAVQNSDAPSLSATPGDSQVTLNWAPTQLGQALGYEICTSSTPLTDPHVGACSGSSTTVEPTETSTVVSGLTNGTPYWFVVRDNAGIWSKVATTTPMGSLGIAQPTAAIIGDGSIQVYWDEPSTTGGYKGIVSYTVFLRPLGTQVWLLGPQGITARTTLLPDLINGMTYEIGVAAQTDDGGLSSLSTITATPQAAPTLSYATPLDWPQNTPITLTPTIGQLQGNGAYTKESGELPDGLSLDPGTGVISGTPTVQQSKMATIRLTDGTTGLYTDATVSLNIIAPSPDPQLWYPVIQATVGNGPVSSTPTHSGIPAGAVWSVYTEDSLPDGFGIDSATGVISGTPTTAPGHVIDITIQACWGTCDPLAGEVRLAPMLFYIVPNLQYPANTQATTGVVTTVTPTVTRWTGGEFSIESGSLPTGMDLDPVTGIISGIPQAASTSPLTIRYSTGVNVTDPPLEYVYSALQINVAFPIIMLSYPAVTAYIGRDLSVFPSVSGVTGATVYTIVSGELPQGLSIDPATGAIIGVPIDTPGNYPVVIEVTDIYGSQRTSLVIELIGSTIPTLSELGMIILAFILAVSSIIMMRIRRRNSGAC